MKEKKKGGVPLGTSERVELQTQPLPELKELPDDGLHLKEVSELNNSSGETESAPSRDTTGETESAPSRDTTGETELAPSCDTTGESGAHEAAPLLGEQAQGGVHAALTPEQIATAVSAKYGADTTDAAACNGAASGSTNEIDAPNRSGDHIVVGMGRRFAAWILDCIFITLLLVPFNFFWLNDVANLSIKVLDYVHRAHAAQSAYDALSAVVVSFVDSIITAVCPAWQAIFGVISIESLHHQLADPRYAEALPAALGQMFYRDLIVGFGGSLLIWVLYYMIFEWSKLRATPGNRMLNIQVVSPTGERLTWQRAFVRSIGQFVVQSIVVGLFFSPMLLAWAIVWFLSRQQIKKNGVMWFDLLTKTRLIKRSDTKSAKELLADISQQNEARDHRQHRSNIAPVKSGEVAIGYKDQDELTRWINDRFQTSSNNKAAFFIGFVLLFVCGAAIYTGGDLMHLIDPANIASQAANASPTATSWLSQLWGPVPEYLVCGALYSLVGAFIWYYIKRMHKPSQMLLKGTGLAWLRKADFGTKWVTCDERAWQGLTSIKLRSPSGMALNADSILVFNWSDGSEKQVKVGCIYSPDDREALLKAIERWAPDVPRDPEVEQALRIPPNYSYTEIWMQALAAPPQRERLKPLESGVLLHSGRYKVMDKLGVGGQGMAYSANDAHEDKTVVVKEYLMPLFVDVDVRKQALQRFENEARVLRNLDHPSIVKLLDFFIEDHRAYLVLEYIEGETLRQTVQRTGPQTEQRALQLTLQMTEALAYLHAQEPPVVHRDFTPDNLMINKEGHLKVIDFNVAHCNDASTTTTSTAVGKPGYLPLEQFQGDPCPQSDLYALGASLFYITTAREPEALTQSHPIVENQALSGEFDQMVAKATAIDVASRYVTAQEINEQAQKLLQEDSVAVV